MDIATVTKSLGLTLEMVPSKLDASQRLLAISRGEFRLYLGSRASVETWLRGYRAAIHPGAEESALIDECARLEVLILDDAATEDDEARYQAFKARLPPNWDLLQALRALGRER